MERCHYCGKLFPENQNEKQLLEFFGNEEESFSIKEEEVICSDCITKIYREELNDITKEFKRWDEPIFPLKRLYKPEYYKRLIAAANGEIEFHKKGITVPFTKFRKYKLDQALYFREAYFKEEYKNIISQVIAQVIYKIKNKLKI